MTQSRSSTGSLLRRAARLLARAGFIALCAGAVALGAGVMGAWLRSLPPNWAGAGVLILLLAAIAFCGLAIYQRHSVRAARRLSERARRSVLRRRERFEALVRAPHNFVFVRERDGRVRYANDAATTALGCDVERLKAVQPFALVANEDIERVQRFFADEVVPQQGLSRPLEFTYVDQSGGAHVVRVVFNNLLDDPDVAGIVEVAEDIGERRELERELNSVAWYDALTGLPNRAAFLRSLADRTGGSAGEPTALLVVDVDHLALVNDSLGRSAGDALLAGMAKRLEGCIRGDDLLARLDGDEFALLLTGEAVERSAPQVAERVLNRLAAPFRITGHEVFAGASIGIAVAAAPVPGEELLRRADVALHRAKLGGKGRMVVYGAGDEEHFSSQLALAAELRRALQREEFRVLYQPEVDLSSGVICGVEALLRWQHPTRGLLEPDAFLRLAEDTGLIGAVGRWLLVQACHDAARWRIPGHERRPVLCVNLSPQEFASAELVDNIATVLKTSGLKPTTLRLEVTESAVLHDLEGAARVMRAVQRLGPSFAIDDFGTGYGSLNFLRRLPFDTLKLDGDLVRAVDRDPRTRVMVAAIVEMAHTLAMSVTAEGIETAEQRDVLRGLGCDRGHGYCFAPPVTSEELDALLTAGPLTGTLDERVAAAPVG